MAHNFNPVTTLTEVEQKLASAWVKGDRSFIDALLAPDWTVTDPSGRVLSRQQVLDEAFVSRVTLPCPNHTRHPWARWDAYIYTLDPDTLFDEFRHRGVSFVKELSFIDDGLWGFEITDADGYVLAFFQVHNK